VYRTTVIILILILTNNSQSPSWSIAELKQKKIKKADIRPTFAAHCHNVNIYSNIYRIHSVLAKPIAACTYLTFFNLPRPTAATAATTTATA